MSDHPDLTGFLVKTLVAKYNIPAGVVTTVVSRNLVDHDLFYLRPQATLHLPYKRSELEVV